MTTQPASSDFLKCFIHAKPATLFCDEERCKIPICSECIEKGTHADHQVFGIGVLYKKQIGEKLKEKKDEVSGLKNNSSKAQKGLEDAKLTCETYKSEIEKIFETDLGKALMASVAGNKTDLLASCTSIADKIKDFIAKLKEIPAKCDTVSQGLTLTSILTKAKTIDEKLLIKELNQITDPLLKDGKTLLDKLEKEKIKETIEEFKRKFQMSPATGKKGKKEQADKEEASPVAAETKAEKVASEKKEKKKGKDAKKELKEKKKEKKGEKKEEGSPSRKKKKQSE